MKWVALCLALAVFFSSLTVNVALLYTAKRYKVEEGYCRDLLTDVYEVALEQNNALNGCIGELEEAQLCLPRLKKCLEIK